MYKQLKKDFHHAKIFGILDDNVINRFDDLKNNIVINRNRDIVLFSK